MQAPHELSVRPALGDNITKSLLKLAGILIAAAILAVPRAYADRLYIDIAAPGVKPIPIAVPAMKIVGEMPKTADQADMRIIDELRRDLTMIGEFELVDPVGYLGDPQTEPIAPTDQAYASWKLIQTELLIKSEITSLESGDLRVELHAYDVTRRAFIFGKRYKTPPRAAEEVAHLFANTLMEELTGKTGPFGTEIAFVVKKEKSKNLASIKMNGTGFKMLTRNTSLNLNPVWARDGNSLYLTSYLGGRPNLCRLHLPTREIRYVFLGEGADMPGEESKDGKSLVFASTFDQNTDIYVLDLGSREVRRITENRAIDVSPSWSPDGVNIAFVSDRRGQPNIFTLKAGEPDANPVRLTFSGRHNGEPAWSPDGEKIAYTGMDENGYFQVYIVDPSGKSNMKLTSGRHDTSQPSWSPDGRFLAVTSNKDGKDAIYLIRLSANKMWKISPPGVEASQPAWSYGPVAQ